MSLNYEFRRSNTVRAFCPTFNISAPLPQPKEKL